jgi:hypothetical protein
LPLLGRRPATTVAGGKRSAATGSEQPCYNPNPEKVAPPRTPAGRSSPDESLVDGNVLPAPFTLLLFLVDVAAANQIFTNDFLRYIQ